MSRWLLQHRLKWQAYFYWPPRFIFPIIKGRNTLGKISIWPLSMGGPTTLFHLSIQYRLAQQAKCSLHLIAGDHRLNSSLATVSQIFDLFLGDVLGVDNPIPV
jgi:hypothetical protein